MHILIRSLGLALVLLLLAGCEVPQPMVGSPPAPAAPELPAPEPALPPMPEDPYGLDHPPMAAWDFHREWLENPAAAHHKYRGRTVTLAYARGLVPDKGFPMAALQAQKGHSMVRDRLREEVKLGKSDSVAPDRAGWGPWSTAWHHPGEGRDIHLWCDRGISLWTYRESFFMVEQGPPRDEIYGDLYQTKPGGLESDFRVDINAVVDERYPLIKAHPMLKIHAAPWNDRVYTVHARVLGHVVGYAPHGGYHDHLGGDHRYLHVVLDNCDIRLMDITAAELDAWFDFDRARRADPESAPYRPITESDQVVPVAEPLKGTDVKGQGDGTGTNRWVDNIVARTPDGQHYILQNGLYRFQELPVTGFTEPRADAPPLPVMDLPRLGDADVGRWDALRRMDELRNEWVRAEEGDCTDLGINWPECVPEARRAWMSDPDNLAKWNRVGGD